MTWDTPCRRGSAAIAAMTLLALAACGQEQTSDPLPGSHVEPAVVEPARPQPLPSTQASLAVEAEPVRGQSRIPLSLQGDWHVVRQTVSGTGIQAYVDDDPELIGSVLHIREEGAVWDGDRTPLAGRCDDAWFDGQGATPDAQGRALAKLGLPAGRGLYFLCRGQASDWGVSGETMDLTQLPDGRIALDYTDNLVLVLERR